MCLICLDRINKHENEISVTIDTVNTTEGAIIDFYMPSKNLYPDFS